VLLGPANLVDRTVRDGEVDLVRRSARFLGPEPEVAEQRLGHAVVALVLQERSATSVGQPALAPEPRDESELLERPEMGQRRRGSDMEPHGDLFEARAAHLVLPRRDDTKSLDLTMGQLLQSLHEGKDVSEAIYQSP
jgi:hypothetical protein